MADEPGREFDVFLLYNSREGDSGRQIYSELRERGIRVYFDSVHLPPGSDWQEYEESILARHPLVLLLLGAAGWGPSHRKLAIELTVRKFDILPVLIGDADPAALDDAGGIFRRLKYIAALTLHKRDLDAIADAVRARLARSGSPFETPPPLRQPARPAETEAPPWSTRPPGSGPFGPTPPPGSVPAPTGAPRTVPREFEAQRSFSTPPPGAGSSGATPQPGSPSPAPPREIDLQIPTRAVSEISDVDLLGFTDYAEALADFIKNDQTEKPITIGIEAPWGMGKTRLMRMIRDRLFQLDARGLRTDIPTVWFDAWKYDKEESLWAALALEVLSQTRARLSTWRWLKVWIALNWRRKDNAMLAKSVLNLTVYALLFGITLLIVSLLLTNRIADAALSAYLQKAGLAAAAAVALKGLYAVHKRLSIPFDEKIARYVKQPKYDERVGFIARFQEDFREVVNVVTGGNGQPLVIFIDDLDRCTPAKAVEVLEAINLLLDSQHCVFLIGMDAKAVTASIEAKYKDVVGLLQASDDPGGLTLGQRFLEKILQIEFRLPPPSDVHMEGYVNAILGAAAPARADKSDLKRQAAIVKDALTKEEQKGKTLDEAAASAPLANVSQKVVAEAKAERFAESFDSYDVVRKAVKSAARLLYNNPRKVKRFVNTFRLQALIANRRKLLEEKVIDLELLAMWLVAETRWPELMNDILADPTLLAQADFARKARDQYHEKQDEATARALQVATEDPRVKRLADAAEAAPLLTELRKRAGDRLDDYLHLGRIVAHVTAAENAAHAG